jgi:hypothetical protein
MGLSIVFRYSRLWYRQFRTRLSQEIQDIKVKVVGCYTQVDSLTLPVSYILAGRRVAAMYG